MFHYETSPVEFTATNTQRDPRGRGWSSRNSCAIGKEKTMTFRKLLALLAALTMFATACGSTDAADVVDSASEAVTDAVDEAGDAMADEEEAMEEGAMEEEADHSEDAMEEESREEDAMEEEAMAEEDAMEEELANMKIVSLSPTSTEMLFAVGAGDKVIAVDAFSNYPPEAPITDLSGFEPNVEAIAGYEPTIVFSQSPIEGLEDLGIENMVLPAAVSFDDVYTQIEQVGAKTGNVAAAAELVANMQGDIKDVLAALPERETALTYYHELDPTLFSVTSTTFVGEVYKLLGLENAADPADPEGESFGYPQLSEEYLVTADPDIIFLADTKCCEQTAETVAARPGWDQLSAVKNGNVIELDDDTASRWGPRLVEFIQTAGAAVAAIESVPAS